MSKRTFKEFLQSLVDSGTDYWVDTITRADALSVLDTYNKLEALKKLPDEHGIVIRSGRYFGIKYYATSGDKDRFIWDFVEIMENHSSGETAK